LIIQTFFDVTATGEINGFNPNPPDVFNGRPVIGAVLMLGINNSMNSNQIEHFLLRLFLFVLPNLSITNDAIHFFIYRQIKYFFFFENLSITSNRFSLIFAESVLESLKQITHNTKKTLNVASYFILLCIYNRMF